MNQSSSGFDNRDNSHQPIIYAYPPSTDSRDEVDLSEMLIRFSERWKVMMIIIISGSLISIALAFTLPHIYKADATLSLPTEADVSPFVTNGLNVGSAKVLFKRYYDRIRSQDHFAQFLKINNYLSQLFPGNNSSQDKQLGLFFKDFSVAINEPLPETKGGIVNNPERISLRVTHSNEELIASLLSSYVKYTDELLVETIVREQQTVVKGQISQLEAKITVLRFNALEKRQAEIARLTAENMEREKTLNNLIEATLAKSVADTKDRIIQIKEARAVAESLGIIYPTGLKDIKGSASEKEKLQTLIKVNESESLPLFLMGTRYLDSLVISINDRKNEAAFVNELNDLRKQIKIIKNDEKLAALNSRVSDDPYISEMPAIKSKIAELRALSLDFSDAKLYTLEKAPLVTEVPIKPNRNLVIVLGAVLSCIFAILAGLIAIVFQKPAVDERQLS